MLSLPLRVGRILYHVFLPWRLYVVAASEQQRRDRGRKTEKERERESKPCRCRYLPATFLYCKRQGALKVNPANRAEATCFGNLGIVRYPARCTSENCIPSSSLSLSGNCSTPSPSPFSSTVLLRLPFLRKATYLCTRAILPYRGGHQGIGEVTFCRLMSCAPSRTRVVTTFHARL